MGPKPKTFDCVECKRQAQRRLRAEYEARKEEFDCYVEFLKAKVHEDEWTRKTWARLGGDD